MSTNRANEVLEKSVYLTFKERERLQVSILELSQGAIISLLKMLGVIRTTQGTLTNIGLKFTKAGECRIKIGQQNRAFIIVVIPNAGTAKEFKNKLLLLWASEQRTPTTTPTCIEQMIKEQYDIPEDEELEEILTPPDTELQLESRPSQVGTIGARRTGQISRRRATQTLAISSALVASMVDTPFSQRPKRRKHTPSRYRTSASQRGEVVIDEPEQIKANTIETARAYEHGRATAISTHEKGMVVDSLNRRPRPTKKPHNPWEHSGLIARVVNKDEDDISW